MPDLSDGWENRIKLFKASGRRVSSYREVSCATSLGGSQPRFRPIAPYPICHRTNPTGMPHRRAAVAELGREFVTVINSSNDRLMMREQWGRNHSFINIFITSDICVL